MPDKVVPFDAAEFRAAFPQFAQLRDETLQMYFNAACRLLDNTERSMVQETEERKSLLYMLVCHIATLKANGGDGLVGTLTSATQGKVSVSVAPFANANWYNSTQCGAMYWEATAKYRTGIRYTRYYPNGGGCSWRR